MKTIILFACSFSLATIAHAQSSQETRNQVRGMRITLGGISGVGVLTYARGKYIQKTFDETLLNLSKPASVFTEEQLAKINLTLEKGQQIIIEYKPSEALLNKILYRKEMTATTSEVERAQIEKKFAENRYVPTVQELETPYLSYLRGNPELVRQEISLLENQKVKILKIMKSNPGRSESGVLMEALGGTLAITFGLIDLSTLLLNDN